MNIRQFNIIDQEDVIALWKASDLVVPWNDPEKDIQRKLKVNPELFLVGEVDGEIIATAMGGYDGHRGWINYLAVSSEFRGNGFGAKMVAYIETQLRQMGCPKINVQIRKTNHQVIEFYSGLDYKNDPVVNLGKRLESDIV